MTLSYIRMAPKVGTFGTYRNRKSTESTFEQDLVYRNARNSKVLPKLESLTETRKSYRNSKVLPKVETHDADFDKGQSDLDTDTSFRDTTILKKSCDRRT